jgi:protein-disulfide isomerase/uncharacterized membrane protein
MKQHMRTWLFVFVLLGLGASLGSFYVQYRMLGDPAYSSFCNYSELFNCDAAYRSRFGTFQGLPVALGGIIWFTLALLLTMAVDPKGAGAESGAAAYLFLISIPAVSIVLFLAYASIFILNVVCILCVASSFAALGVFIFSGVIADAPLSGLPQQAVRDVRALAARPFGLGVAIVFLAGAGSAVAFFPRAVVDPAAVLAAALAHQPTDFDLWFESQIRVPIDVPADGAEVLIVKFNDYQCPTSAETYKTHAPVLATYQTAQPGKVKVILKDYPLESECNPNVARTVHAAACEGAVAVRLADRQQRGVAMEEWLYTHKAGLTRAAVRQAAKEIGGGDDFDAEYPRVLASIKSDVDLGARLGVKGTPTFFINGVRIEGAMEPRVLDQAIAHELRVRAPKP